MANIVYFTMFVLSAINIVLLSIVVKQQRCFYSVTLFMLIFISCFGFVTMANASSITVALLGNILTYFGACFLPYCFLLYISELCQTPIKNWVKLVMLAYNVAVFYLIWITLDGVTLYYSDMRLIQQGGISMLVTEPGPLRILYEISVVFYALAVIAVLVHAFRRNKNISYKNLWMLTSLELVTMLIYAYEKIFDHTVDWVCLAYIIDEFILLVLIYRIGKYDVSESIAGSINGQEDYVYMNFDMKLNYLGCSPMLKEYFPDITHVKVDRPIDPQGNPVIEKAVAWLAGDKIPLEARIMALADVFDALVSKRCYKEKYSYEEAFQIIEDSLGTHFDPELGKAFLSCRKELEAYYDEVDAK